MIEENISYNFQNKSLLKEALIHPSIDHNQNFERLEFLGDRILNLIISEYLYINIKKPEGFLSKKLSVCINRDSLYRVASIIQLSKFMQYRAEKVEHHNYSMICDCLEAIIAAIYLDSDYDNTKLIVLKLWQGILVTNEFNNAKTKLQELMQKKFNQLPEYVIVSTEGKEHNRVFNISLKINNQLFYGSGRTKKIAENAAAEKALAFFQK